MQKRLFLLMVILTGTLLFCLSCEKKGVKEITPSELIQQGWLKFEAGNFAGAGSDFSAALSIATIKIDSSDAFLGLGWAQLRQYQGGLADNSLVKYLSFGPGLPELNDGRAGLAFAYATYSTTDKFREAIDTANVVLSSNPTWTFSHDNSVNADDLHLVLAQCYYLSADFRSSLDQVKSYFNPSFDPDTTQIEWKGILADEIKKWWDSTW